jgi:hypothetical protein
VIFLPSDALPAVAAAAIQPDLGTSVEPEGHALEPRLARKYVSGFLFAAFGSGFLFDGFGFR